MKLSSLSMVLALTLSALTPTAFADTVFGNRMLSIDAFEDADFLLMCN